MAKCTNLTFLKIKQSASADYEKLIDITEYPDLGGETEKLDATTMSDKKKRNIDGLEDSADLVFKALYELSDYKKLHELEISNKLSSYQLWFGEDGADGIWEWEGKLHVYPVGGGVNAVREMSFSITDEGDSALAPVFSDGS